MDIATGSYRCGDSFLHRVDSRVKLLLLIGLVACLFSSASWQRPLLILFLWLALAGTTSNGIGDLWRIVKMLRWLLFFTLVVHLLFTPGRTMFGTSWLSYDGLLRGAMINIQLLLAVLFSLLLAWTTRPEALAAGLTTMLKPLQRFKLPVHEAGGMLLLVLHFFPHIQHEVQVLKSSRTVDADGLLAGLKSWVGCVEPLLTRMFDHADTLAYNIVSGTNVVDSITATRLFDRSALVAVTLGAVLVLLLWQV